MTDAPSLFADDLIVGDTINLGTFHVDEPEMLAFARRWDPQAFHLDQAAAADTMFGQVIASGAMSLAIFQRLAVLGAFQHWAVIAGRRITNLEFRRPVLPNQELLAELTITANRAVQPSRSLLSLDGTLATEAGPVLTLTMDVYVARTQAEEASKTQPESA